ncbi:MAG: hypothetical protein ACRD2L_18200 [Terriglobia bacterium]
MVRSNHTPMELSKEHFDQQLGTLNHWLGKIEQRMDGMATKTDPKPLAAKTDVREGIEELARIIATTVANPMEHHFAEVKAELAMHQRVRQLETDMQRIKEALHIV